MEIRHTQSLFEFQQMFPSEMACAAYLEAIRQPDGFACPTCGVSNKVQRIVTRPRMILCRHCHSDVALTAGTVMHATWHPSMTSMFLSALPARILFMSFGYFPIQQFQYVRPIVRGKAGRPVEFGAKIWVSLVDGVGFVDRISWDVYNKWVDFVAQIDAYRRRFGHDPASIHMENAFFS